jgi:hypothetical protein
MDLATDSMQQSNSTEADSYSADQEISAFYVALNVITEFSPFNHILSYLNTVENLTYHSFKIYFNVIPICIYVYRAVFSIQELSRVP